MTEIIEIRGIEAVERKLKAVPGAAYEVVQELAGFVQAEARKGAKPHAADTGAIAELVKTRLAPGGLPLWAKVKAYHPLSNAVEFGTRPGKRPRWRPIERWAERHGIASPGLVVQAILRSGTKGVFFMQKALEAGEKKAPELIRKVGKKIEAGWGKR